MIRFGGGRWYSVVIVLLLFAVFARPLKAKEDTKLEWPKEILVPGYRVVIYQPQVDSLKGDKLTGRAALSIRAEGKEELVFGALWLVARITTDRDTRTVTLHGAKVSRARFPNVTPEQEEKLKAVIQAELPKWNMEMSLDALLTALEAAKLERTAAQGLKMDPPKIYYVEYPATLILIDGDPVLLKIENSSLKRVVNCPYLMVFDPSSKTYFLNGGYVWYRTKEVKGPWREEKNPPAEVAAMVTKEALTEAGVKKTDTKNTRIIVDTVPAELLSVDGEPKWKPFSGNKILYITNTDSDILLDVDSQQYYTLLSGRWYTTKSPKQGGWKFVPPEKVPAAFAEIPPGSDKAHLRAQVPGTVEAQDAVMDAQIPQTAAVSRKKANLKVDYDGKPKFKPVEGAGIDYAVNTSTSVLKIGNIYYSCDQGVWFKSHSAEGPWELADSVPAEVQKIPPSNPTYNTKYVYIYESTPEVVYVGYTPAYTGCYPYHGTVVYGTGWHYAPWISPYHYYPRPWSFGFHVRYNPWTGGWGFGISFGYGGFGFSFGWGSGWYGGPWWGPRPGWFGPAGYRAGYRHGFRAGYWAGRYANRPSIQPIRTPRAGNPRIHDRAALARGRDRMADRANIYQRPSTRDRMARTPQTRDRSARIAGRPANTPDNLFTDRNGNVYRRTDNGWERRDRDGWKKTNPATRPATGTRPSTRPAAGTRPSTRPAPGTPSTRPTTRPTPGTRPSTRPTTEMRPAKRPSTAARPSTPSTTRTRPSPSTSRLNRDYSARQQATSRTRNYQRSHSSGGTRSRGGMRRR